MRDADVLNRLFPVDGWPPVERLQVMRDGETIGWAAVLHRKMNDEPRFGDLHLGNITDCFAAPDDAADVIAAAMDHLQKTPAEMVYANMSHPAWIEAMAANGCVLIPNRTDVRDRAAAGVVPQPDGYPGVVDFPDEHRRPRAARLSLISRF